MQNGEFTGTYRVVTVSADGLTLREHPDDCTCEFCRTLDKDPLPAIQELDSSAL
jgi:hypothetical protein